ncbi:unnamed protein product, partial [Didymodactylos carnosus]
SHVDLPKNIRRILDSIDKKLPDVENFTENDRTIIQQAAHRAVDSSLLSLLEKVGANDDELLLNLIRGYITNTNDLAHISSDEDELKKLNFPSIIINRLKEKLECKRKLLALGIDESTNTDLFNSITAQYPTVKLFKSMPFKQLTNLCGLANATLDQQQTLQNLWIEDVALKENFRKYNVPLTLIDRARELGVTSVDDLTTENIQEFTKSLEQNGIEAENVSRANLKRL